MNPDDDRVISDCLDLCRSMRLWATPIFAAREDAGATWEELRRGLRAAQRKKKGTIGAVEPWLRSQLRRYVRERGERRR